MKHCVALMTFNKTTINERNFMTKQSNKKTNDKIEKNDDAKIMCVADVARELNIDAKRARAFLRKNVELYTMRNQKFTKTSSLYKQCVDALTIYKNKSRVVTQ